MSAGSWYVEKPYGEKGVYIADAADTSLVAKIWNDDMAKARLIAAAPELLAALKAAIEVVNFYAEKETESANALQLANIAMIGETAIAKAEGTK